MLFSVNGAAALTRAFKREALASSQSDIAAFVSHKSQWYYLKWTQSL